MSNENPYSFDEATNFGNGFPDRGLLCQKCKTLIPQFEKFKEKEISKFGELLKTKGKEQAEQYIISLTGCSYRWAKIWVLHPNGPNKNISEAGFDLSTECPLCNKPLRTNKAKQCPHCFENWR